MINKQLISRIKKIENKINDSYVVCVIDEKLLKRILTKELSIKRVISGIKKYKIIIEAVRRLGCYNFCDNYQYCDLKDLVTKKVCKNYILNGLLPDKDYCEKYKFNLDKHFSYFKAHCSYSNNTYRDYLNHERFLPNDFNIDTIPIKYLNYSNNK
jgi:hypothetical protein